MLDYALQVETYYLIYQVLCSIKALEFCRRGPYYVTACQLFDFSDQLQFDAQLNKLFVQNFHCNSFFFIGCYTNMNYVWLDKKGDKNCTWRGKKEFAPHWKSEMDRFFLYQIQTDAVNCNEEMISSFLVAVQSTIEVSQCIKVISDGALFVLTIWSILSCVGGCKNWPTLVSTFYGTQHSSPSLRIVPFKIEGSVSCWQKILFKLVQP